MASNTPNAEQSRAFSESSPTAAGLSPGAAGSLGPGVSGSPPLPSSGFLSPVRFQLGGRGLFHTVKSCSNLEQLAEQSPALTPCGSTSDVTETGARNTPPTMASLALTRPSRYGDMFRTVRSCGNLEKMGMAAEAPAPAAPPTVKLETPAAPAVAGGQQQSGLMFGSLKSYLAKSNMVSGKDHNVIAPMSY